MTYVCFKGHEIISQEDLVNSIGEKGEEMALIETEYKLHYECVDCPVKFVLPQDECDDPRLLTPHGTMFETAVAAESHVFETGHQIHVHGILRCSRHRQEFLWQKERERKLQEKRAQNRKRSRQTKKYGRSLIPGPLVP